MLEVAQKVARAVGKPHIEPEISGKYRVGDIRHCFADIRLARRLLGYDPQVSVEEGVAGFCRWYERSTWPRSDYS